MTVVRRNPKPQVSVLEKLEKEYEEHKKRKRKSRRIQKNPCRKCGDKIEVGNVVCEPCRKLRVKLTNSTKWYLEKGLVMVWLYGHWILQPQWLARKNKAKGCKTYPTEF